jgi:hypothetical protein
VYASSSSALATGSALTFDGSTLNTTGDIQLQITKSFFAYTNNYGIGTPDSSGLQIFYGSGDSLRFGTRSSGTFTELMRLSSGGNLGLGVTPSAWGSGTKAFQVGSYGSVNTIGGIDVGIANNAYNDGTNWKYIASQEAAYLKVNRNTFLWNIAAAGTAGNTISFTQAMTLAADGNLGIGTTSPNNTLHLKSETDANIKFEDTTSGTAGFVGPSANNQSDTTATRLGIRGEAGVAFSVGSATKMALDSSGNLLVNSGQTNLVGGLSVGTSSLQGSVIYFGSSVIAAGAGTYPLKWNSSTGVVTYDTSSRLVKENIEDSPYGLSEVLQLKSRKYHRTDDKRNEIGLVADEVQAVMPEFVPLVAKSIFTKDESDTELIAGGVNYDKLTSVLIKAIQEQQAMIESLRQRLSAANL